MLSVIHAHQLRVDYQIINLLRISKHRAVFILDRSPLVREGGAVIGLLSQDLSFVSLPVVPVYIRYPDNKICKSQ